MIFMWNIIGLICFGLLSGWVLYPSSYPYWFNFTFCIHIIVTWYQNSKLYTNSYIERTAPPSSILPIPFPPSLVSNQLHYFLVYPLFLFVKINFLSYTKDSLLFMSLIHLTLSLEIIPYQFTETLLIFSYSYITSISLPICTIVHFNQSPTYSCSFR